MIYFLDDYLGLDGYSCAGSKLFPIFQTVKFAIRVVQIAVPFALIIWGSLDWFKALIAHDEKEMRIKRKPFVSRVIAAVLIIVLPWIIELISKQLAGTNEFWTCYAEAKPKINFKGMELDPDDEPAGGELKGGGSSGGTGTGKVITGLKANCADYTTEIECKKGSQSHNCKWSKDYSSQGGHCGNDTVKTAKELLKSTCEEMSMTECSAGSTDYYGAACLFYKKDGESTPKCHYHPSPKSCTDYGKEISRTSCPTEDDYGKKCFWNTKNGSTGDCIYSSNN